MIHLTAKLVAAYLGNHTVATSDIPEFIRLTYAALVGTTSADSPSEDLRPSAVPVKKSITSEAIICLDCGKHQKTLKRHLRTAHGLTPDDYRAKWSLPATYPMVAPDYAERRSQMARQIGLGRKPKAAGVAEVVKPKRGRPRLS